MKERTKKIILPAPEADIKLVPSHRKMPEPTLP